MLGQRIYTTLACLTLAACGQNSAVASDDSAPRAATSSVQEAEQEIDVEALLAKYGFVRCDRLMPNTALTDERRQEIYQAMLDADLGNGAALDPGYRAWLSLYVLNEQSLATLATIADPSEVCLSGQDPNDYVPPGPQPTGGTGWRWLASAEIETTTDLGLIVNHDAYDAMWSAFSGTAKPPDGPQPTVDFDREAVLTIRTGGTGISTGGCGHRFDGYNVKNNLIVIDWFTPGGETGCPGAYVPGTVAIALDRDIVGEPPLAIALRRGPREHPTTGSSVAPGQGVFGWPLAELLNETFGQMNSPPTTTDLADAVECRLFQGASSTPIIGGSDVPTSVVQATTQYVQTIEILMKSTTDPIPRETTLGNLAWIVGTPSQTPSCSTT